MHLAGVSGEPNAKRFKITDASYGSGDGIAVDAVTGTTPFELPCGSMTSRTTACNPTITNTPAGNNHDNELPSTSAGFNPNTPIAPHTHQSTFMNRIKPTLNQNKN